MSSLIYKDHPIHATIARVLEMQKMQEFSYPNISANAEHMVARDKIFSVAKVVQELLNSTPAELTSLHALTAIQNGLQQPLTELNTYLSNGNIGHLTTAALLIEQGVMPFLWGFLPKSQSLSVKALSGLLEAQATVAQNTIVQLSTKEAELSKQLSELTVKAEEQNARFEALAEGAAKERAEAAATVAKLEQAFTEKETGRAEAFDTALGGFGESFLELRRKLEIESSGLIDSIDGQRLQAKQIVEVVGNIGVTGNYQQIANKETAQANFWRWATVIFFAVGISVAVATFIKFWSQPFSFENTWSVIIRLLYAIAITAPAWYTARESARHRTNGDRARQTEIELASIGPFIELMPEEKKIEIRQQLTTVYFGKGVDAHVVDSPFTGAALKDLASEIVKAIRK